ncbi:hypothetical protein BJ983_003797 [Actinomycetospora corticicola]|uniref:Uncharacterized protein n=1 Tax=Actinomycetospora corticicola TaxID=663602 RepID=A0A7Y9DYC3_9PSEU|nr:hypothetical protein [Actinomycetospora corticicola]
MADVEKYGEGNRNTTIRGLEGERFGLLVVLRYCPFSERPESARQRKDGAWWYCRCDCGSEKAIRGTNLKQGASRSCGCQSRRYGFRAA